MNEAREFTLIKGLFSAAEAKEILLTLINHKINFHELRNFSSQIRHGEHDLRSVARIEELRRARLGVMEMVREHEKNAEFQIDCTISIKPAHSAFPLPDVLAADIIRGN